MAHELISEEPVNIYKLPSVDTSHKGGPGTQITIGDLHANAMKLLFILVKHGIATGLSEEDYDTLGDIYLTDPLTTDLLKEFNKILSKIQFSKGLFVRLIGDELADRGMNDYFILKILEKLKQHEVPFEIIISNHAIEFILAYEKGNAFNSNFLVHKDFPSMIRLESLVKKGKVTRKEILEIAEKSYKPTLSALSYSLSEDQKEITIYSHAGIGLKNIRNLAQLLNISYKDEEIRLLVETIDGINREFQKHLFNKTIKSIYKATNVTSLRGDNAAFEFILWNRSYDHLDRPAVHSGYRIAFVHGHDSNEPTDNNIYNLDNNLGKEIYSRCLEYTALYSKVYIKNLVTESSIVNQNDIKLTLSSFNDRNRHFLCNLGELKIKADNLRDRGYSNASQAALQLHSTLDGLYKKLLHKEIDIPTFKDHSISAIDLARIKLKEHHSCMQILGNLGLAVVGVGIFYVIAGLIHQSQTGNFLFFQEDTYSAKKIDELEKSVRVVV